MAENTNTNKPFNDELSLSSPVSYSSKEHDDIIDSLREATVSYDPDSKIDMESIRFIDNQAASINKNSPINPVRFNAPYPGNVSDNRNPFSNQTAQLDLTTTQGRRDYLGGIGQTIQNKVNDVPHGGAWKNPIIFGKKQMNADRYMAHEKFSDLGFHPFVDNETYYNQNSTAWDDLSRTSSAFVSMFKPAFTSGWRALKDTLSGDPFKMDYEGAEAMRDAMRIASSTRGGVTGFMNDLYLNSSYTFGIVGSMFVEEAALAFMGGYLIPSIAATRNAGRFKHLFSAMDGVGTGAKTVGNYSADLMRSIGATDKGRDFYNYAKGTGVGKSGDWLVRQLMPETTKALQTINSTKNTANNLTNLAKVNKTFGGFYRDVRMFNIAWAESRLEGGLRDIESTENAYMAAKKANDGEALTDAQWEIVKNSGKSAGLKTALMNFPIIYLSNRFVLDTALRGFKPLGRLLQENRAGLGRNIMRTGKLGQTAKRTAGAAVKEGDKAFRNLGTSTKRMYHEGIKGGLLGLGAFGVKYMQANLAEGFQELAQEAVSAGVGDYYETLLDEVLSDSINMNSAELEDRIKNADASWMKSMKAGTQSEAVSFETFMSGFLMGGIVQPFQTIMFEHMPNMYKKYSDREAFDAYDAKKKEYAEMVVNRLDEMWNDPTKFFDITKLDALNQRKFNRALVSASYAGDTLSFIDAQDQSEFGHIYTMLQHNKAGDFKAHIEAFLNMSDTDLVDAFENSDEAAPQIRKKFKGILEKIDQIQDNYNNFNDKYVNPFNPDNFEEGTRIHAQEAIRHQAFEHAKMVFLFQKHSYERGVERMNSIVQAIKSDPTVTTLDASDIDALIDISPDQNIGGTKSATGLNQQIFLLEEEISIPLAKNANKNLKDIRKKKEKRLEILKEYKTEIFKKENYKKSGTETTKKGEKIHKYTNTLTKSGKNKIKSAFIKYLNHIQETNGGQIKDNDGIDKAFEMIIDYKALNGRTRDMYKVQQALDNPDSLNIMSDRIAIAMNGIWKHHKKKTTQRQKVSKFMNQQERGKIISDLARKGIYTNVEDAELFIKTGAVADENLPLKFVWYSENSRVTLTEDTKTYLMIAKVLGNYAKQKEAEAQSKEAAQEDVAVDETVVETGPLDTAEDIYVPAVGDTQEEDDVSGLDIDAEGRGMPSDMFEAKVKDFKDFILNKDPSLYNMLQKLFAQYEYEVANLGKKDFIDQNLKGEDRFWAWVQGTREGIKTLGGAPYVRSRFALYLKYDRKSNDYKNKYSFDKYLYDHHGDQFFIKITGKQGLKNTSILTETHESGDLDITETLEKDLKKGEKIVKKYRDTYKDAGLQIISKTVANNDGTLNTHYIIKTINGDNAFNIFQGLPNAKNNIEEYYFREGETKEGEDSPGLKAAKEAADWLVLNMPKQETIDFVVDGEQKEQFNNGEVILDKNQNRYTVEESLDDGSLKVKNLKEETYTTIDPGTFESEGWTRASQQKINPKVGKKKTKLKVNEPLQLYPFDSKTPQDKSLDTRSAKQKRADRVQAKENVEKTLQQLDQEQIDNLEIRIEKNPDYDEVMSVDPSERRKFPRIDGNPVNEQLRLGTSQYRVVIYNNKVVEGKKINEPILILQGPEDATLLDIDGETKINPLLITQKQAGELFYGAKHSTVSHTQIQNNYASAFAMQDVFKKLLKESNKDSASISIRMLRENHKIHMSVDGGTFAYTTEEPVFRTDEGGNNILVRNSDGSPKMTEKPAITSMQELFKNGFTLGEGFSGKNRDGDKEPKYLIFDQQQLIINGEISIGDPITNIDMGDPGTPEYNAYIRLIDKIQASMRGEGIDLFKGTLGFPNKRNKIYNTVKSGRYVYFVFSPGIGRSGEFTAIQLKTKQKSAKEIHSIFTDLRNAMGTTSKLTKDGGNIVINPKTKKQDIEDNNFANNLINKELKEKLFISAKPGQHITIGVSNYGKLEVNYYNSDAISVNAEGKNGIGWEIKIEYSKTDFDNIAKGNIEGILKPEDLINHINKRLNQEVQKRDDIKKTIKVDNKDVKIPNLEVNIKVTGESISFRNSLPKTISGKDNNFKYLSDNTEAIIGVQVRDNVRGIMTSADNQAIQIIKENAANLSAERSKPKETSKPKESGRVSVEDKETWDEMRKDEFKNVDENILNDIADEIAEYGEIQGDEDNVAANRKREILNHAIPSIEINRKVEEINITKTKNEVVKKIDPSENQEEQQLLDDAKMALKLLIVEKRKYHWELRSNKESDQYIEDKGERRKQYIIDANNDPQVIEAQKLVNDLTKDLNDKYKITKDFDGRDVEDINVFLDWLKKNLPNFIQVRDINDLASRLKNNGITVGAFLTSLKVIAGKKEFIGEIYTDASSGFRYHEAFHAVFNLLLSDSEQVKYLKIAKKGKLAELRAAGISPKQALEDLKLMSPTYSKMTQQELENTLYEEWLADKFEEFKKNPQKVKVDSEVKSLFQRILDWIVSIFERTSIANARIELSRLDPTLHRLFKDIDSGKFKSSNFADNKYTQAVAESSGGISNTKFAITKSIEQVRYEVEDINSPGDFVTRIRSIVIPMPAGEVDLMVRRIGALYLSLKEDWTPTEAQPSMVKSKLLKRAIDMFQEMHSIESSQYDKYDPLNDADALMIDKIIETYEALKKPENKKEIYSGVRQYLSIIERVEDTLSDDYIVDEADTETPYDINAKRNQKGGFNNLNEFVRSFFLSATTEVQDVYGNEYVNPNAAPGEKKYKLKQSANYIKVFNGFLKGLSNEPNPTEAIKKLYLFSESNPETYSVAEQLIIEIFGNDGMKKIRNHIYKGTSFPSPLKGKSTLFQAILKAFDQYRVKYVKALRNVSDNNVSLIEADKQNDENWQMQIWSSEFDMLKAAIRNDIAKGTKSIIRHELNNLHKLIAASELKSVAYLKERGLYYKKFFAEKLGIYLSEKFIEYSIAIGKTNKDTLTDGNYIVNLLNQFSDQRPIEVQDENGWSDLHRLRDSLKEGQNIYNESDNENYKDANDQAEKVTNAAEQTDGSSEGVFYRLQKWAQSNAAFDETIGSTVLYDAEGNYIYVYQVPTLHLQKSAEMNSAAGLKRFLSKNKYLKGNNLAENSKFAAISEAGKAGIIRMLGVKDTSLIKKDGKMIENKALDINTLPGTSYGSLSFNQFIASLINMYGLNFNELTGKANTLEVDGKPFTFSPVLIRVLSESNISDFRNLPNIKVLKYSVDAAGDAIFTDEYTDAWRNRIKRKFDEIQEQSKRLKRGEHDNDTKKDNYNSIINKEGYDILTLETLEKTDSDPTVGRAYKFNFEVDGVLTIHRTPSQNIILTEKDVFKVLSKIEQEKIKGDTNKQKVFLKESSIKGLSERNKEAVVTLGDKQYLVKFEGIVESKSFEIDQLKQIVEDLGTDSVVKGEAEQSGFKNTFKIGDEIYSSKYAKESSWFKAAQLKGKNLKYKYRLVPIEEAKRTTQTSPDQLFDNTLKIWLEKQARRGIPFDEAWDDFPDDPNNKTGITADEFMINALNAQYDRFDDMLVSTGAEELIDKKLLTGKLPFGTESKVTSKGKKALKDMHLSETKDHNLRQIYFNNWLNTADINEFFTDNQSMSLKNAVDAGSRAKNRIAGGASVASTIAAPEFNINNPTTNFGLLTISDPLYTKRKGVKKDKGERMDGQSYMTINGFKRFWFGLGKLNKAQNSLIDKVEKGIPVTAEEFFGNIDKGSEGYKQNKNYINSKKFVHSDGNVYLKMSTTILSKELDSYAGTNGNKPLENKKKLWHLRKLAEDWESKNGGMPLMILPRSASKMRRTNVLDPDMTNRIFTEPLTIGEQDNIGQYTKVGKILNDAVEILDANYMRLQQVTPSNKIEIVDPRQIKNIILSEQSDSEIVIIGDKEITVGDLRKMYEYSYTNRVKLNYFGRNSLIFNLSNVFDAIEKSQREGKITPDLEAFLDYAIAALESSQSTTQQLEFFTKIKEYSNPLNGQNKYELNSPFTIQKLTEYMLGFFQKGVIGERQPGKTVTLMSDYGINVFKKVDAIDENGTPIAWTVIREKDWQNMSQSEKEKMLKPNGKNEVLEPEENAEGNLTDLEVKQVYIDRLRHDVIDYKRNAKGKLVRENGELVDLRSVHTEFMLPPHFIEEMNLKSGESIPDIIANQFAVRIPSQDKHSAINLKLVDHLPVYMGSTGVFAHELIEISGADFDIDKVYIQHKEFYKNDKDEFVEYGKGKTVQDRFDEYMMYSEKDMYKKGTNLYYARNKYLSRKRDEDNIIKKSVEDIEEEYASYVINNRNLFVPNTDRKKIKQKFAEEKGYDYDFKADEFEPVYVENDPKEVVKGALNILNLPTNKTDYKNYIEKNKLVIGKGKDEVTLYKEPYAAGYNNNILDLKIALLSNNSMARSKDGRKEAIKNEPAVDTLFSDIWKKWEKENPKVYENNDVEGAPGKFDINNLLGQYKLYKDSKEGSRNISAVVPINTVISWHKVYKTKLRETKNIKKKKNNINELPTLNGWTYDNYDLQYFIDPVASLAAGKDVQRKGADQPRLQDAMSQLISIMVDNQKNPYAGKLGLNKHAAGIAANAIGLGIDLETILLLLNHPTISESYYRGFNRTSATEPGPIQIMQGKIRNYENSRDELKKTIYKMSKKVKVTNEMLTDHSTNFVRISETEATYKGETANETILAQEIAILQQLLNINNIKEANENLISIMSLEKGGIRDLESINDLQKSIDDLGLNLSEKEYNELEVPFEYSFINKIKNENGMIGNNLRIFNHLKKDVLPHLLITASEPFTKLFNLMKGSMNTKVSRDQRLIGESKLRKDILSYLTIKAYINDLSKNPKRWAQERLSSLNNALIYDQMGDEASLRINKIVADTKAYLKEEGKTNNFLDEFIKNQKATAEQNKTGVNVIKSRALQKQTASQVEALQSSFLELMIDPRTRLAADHLAHYLMVMHGLQPRFGSFHQVLVPVIMDVYLQDATRVKELFARASSKQIKRVQDAEFKTVFGMTFSEIAKDLTQWFESASDTHLIQSINEVKLRSGQNQDTATSLTIKGKGGVKSAVLFRSLKKETDENYKDEDDTLDVNLGYNTKFLWTIIDGKKKRIKKSKWGKIKQVETNLKLIQNMGFKTEILPDSGDVVISFPPVLRIKKGNDKNYTYYKLTSHISPYGSTEISDDIYDINEGVNTLYGVAARYVKFTPRGSSYQWKGGFMFNVNKIDGKTEKRPTRNELFKDEETSEIDMGGIEVPEGINFAGPTDLVNTGLTNANTDSDGTVYTNETGEKIASTKGGENIEQVKRENPITKEVESKVTDTKSKVEGINSNLKEQMKIEGVESTTDFTPLRSWYYDMFNKDPQKINTVAQELGLKNTKITDFIQNYENQKEFRNLETYIKMLKCFS